MKHKKLFWKLYPTYVIISLVVCFAMIMIATVATKNGGLEKLYLYGSLFAFLMIIALVFATIVISEQLSKPLAIMKIHADQISGGDFSGRIKLTTSYNLEAYNLGRAINEIAMQLEQRMQTILKQKNEMEAVFGSMIEGVIAVDSSDHVIHMNKAASHMVPCNMENVEGRNIHEVVKVKEIHELLNQVANSNQMLEKELVVENHGKKNIQVHGTTLQDVDGAIIGALLVLNDMTRVRELERHRSEFVSNVSHELKTPLTSIKGFIDTILQHRMTDNEELNHYLNIVQKHANRLEAIIHDLLIISKIEDGREKDEISFSNENLRAVINEAMEICKFRADEKKINISYNGPQSIMVKINAPLMEQAIVNLFDNAIKYSNDSGNITLSVMENEEEVTVSVKDEGCGIATEHLPRIFERFYRVDKARSRKMGGTGLGLSIVKHIAIIHNGSVWAESTEGVGSIFYMKFKREA